MNLIEFYFDYVLRGILIVLIPIVFVSLTMAILMASNTFEFVFFTLITLVLLPGLAMMLYYIIFVWNTL